MSRIFFIINFVKNIKLCIVSLLSKIRILTICREFDSTSMKYIVSYLDVYLESFKHPLYMYRSGSSTTISPSRADKIIASKFTKRYPGRPNFSACSLQPGILSTTATVMSCVDNDTRPPPKVLASSFTGNERNPCH